MKKFILLALLGSALAFGVNYTRLSDLIVSGTAQIGASTGVTSPFVLEVDEKASGKGILVKAHATSPGNLQEWQSSAGSILASVSSGGVITATSFSGTVTGAAYNAQTATYSILAADNTIGFTTSTSTLDATLPTAVGVSGKRYTIIKVDQSTGKVVLKTTSSQTVGGYASAVIIMGTIDDYITVESDGANWKIVDFGIFVGSRVSTSTTTIGTSDTQIVFSSTTYDPWGMYSAGTWTIPITGRYLINGLITTANLAWVFNDAFLVTLYKGGVSQFVVGRMQVQEPDTFRGWSTLSGMVLLSAGDTIDLRAIQSASAALDSGAANIWASITKVK